MKFREFEEHIKNELYHDTAEVDIESLINDIHNPGTQDKDKSKAWLIWSLVVLVLLGGYFTMQFFNNQNNHDSNPKQSTIVSTNADSENNSNLSENVDLDVSERDNSIGNIDLKSKEVNNISNQVSSSSSNQNRNYISNTRILNGNSPHIILDENSLMNKKTTSTKSKLLKANINHSQQVSRSSDNNNTFNTNNNLLKTTIKKQNYKQVQIGSTLQKKLMLASIHQLPSLFSLMLEGEESSIPSLFVDPVKCFDFGINPWTIDLLGEVGVLRPFKNLEYRGPNKEDVFKLRSEKEKSLEGIQAALYAKLSKEKYPMYIKIGGSYTRIAEQVELIYETMVTDTSQGIISITESQNGDTLTVIRGDIYTTTTTTHNSKKHHYFHLFDIPVAIGYERKLGSIVLGGEIGAQFNVYNNAKGVMLSDVDTFEDINASNSFKPSVGISYFAGVNVSKAINYSGSIYLSARFRYLPNNFSSDQNAISQKYSLAGLHLGYQHRL